tara:strand:+ start:503 stop:715 length:213 start_codon:yes stop_codon:yes gene_type:complete
MLSYKKRLKDNHYRFIRGLKDVEIGSFSRHQYENDGSLYIISVVNINNINKRIISILNPEQDIIQHYIKD